jgi:hypothetical protein
MKKKTKEIPIYTADQVFAIAKLLGLVFDMSKSVDQAQRALYSIALDLEVIFSNKRKVVKKSPSLFEMDKKYNVKLKYHEELSLCQIITSMLHIVSDVKAHNDLLIVRNYLHEKIQ